MRKTIMALQAGVAALALVAGSALAAGGAAAAEELDESEIYFETNATDRDVGVHMFVDGEGWTEMNVVDELGKVITRIRANGGAGVIGLTELFIESSEPNLDELSFAEHIELFPIGEYSFEGKATDHTFLIGEAELTLDLPCAPEITQPEEDEELDLDSVEIIWSHTDGILDPDDLVEDEDPADACDDAEDVELVSFHVVVEYEYEDAGGEEVLRVYAVDMEPGATSLTVPEEFLAEGVEEGAEFKVEILAIEESGNRTITEVEFDVVDE